MDYLTSLLNHLVVSMYTTYSLRRLDNSTCTEIPESLFSVAAFRTDDVQ